MGKPDQNIISAANNELTPAAAAILLAWAASDTPPTGDDATLLLSELHPSVTSPRPGPTRAFLVVMPGT